MIKNLKLPLECLWVSLGKYERNKKVKFFMLDENGEYHEITDGGLIQYDENDNSARIDKLAFFISKKFGKKLVPMMCARKSYSKYDPFEDKYDDYLINLPLTTGISYNNVEPVPVKQYLKRMAIDARKNKYIEFEKILECKEILDKLCEKSYIKYKENHCVKEDTL